MTGGARRRPVAAPRAFFPAAAAYAAVALPLSVLGMLGLAPVPPGLATPAAHGHEMLFGFALAAVAGHQLGPLAPRRLAAFFALWLAARAAFLAAPHSLAAAAADPAFALLLGARIAPRFLAGARKLRNRALGLVLAGVCACAAAFPLAARYGPAPSPRAVLLVAVALLAALMLFMGGRIIAPLAAAHAQRRGRRLAAPVQPRLEAPLVALSLVAAIATAFAARAPFAHAAGGAMIGAAFLAALRLARWRPWTFRGAGLAGLAVGYAWLAAGLAALGAALLAGAGATIALHAITAGAIGTLAVSVMSLTWARTARRPDAGPSTGWSVALVSFAALARLGAPFAGAHAAACLAVGALAWAAAFALLLVQFAARGTREVPLP